MAGNRNGCAPCAFQNSTTDFTIVPMLEIPRLPTPIAIRAPLGTRRAMFELESSCRMWSGILAIARLGKNCSARTNRGRFILTAYSSVRSETLVFPALFEHGGVLARGI